MKVVHSIVELRKLIHSSKKMGKTIGLVPTMGFLHEGHLSLVKKAHDYNTLVVMSIFVNPTQFGPNEDFERYPRNIEGDTQLAENSNVDILFIPSVNEMYPSKPLTSVSVQGITNELCGRTRPGHFDGVASVVTKLFHIVQPDFAFFGLKDAQQVAVIQQMVDDLNFPVKIVPCEIVREPDGLAMSSRNVYLSPEEREQALVLNQALRLAEEEMAKGHSPREIRQHVIQKIETKPLAVIDYVELLKYPSLQSIEKWTGETVILALAVKFGNTRLIDNKILGGKGNLQHATNHDESETAPSYSN